MRKILIPSPARMFWRVGLVFVFSLGFSITYALSPIYASEGEKAIDRVCTMQVDKASAETLTKDGYTYYFCSNNCKTTFEENSAKYACICPQLFEGCDCGHCEGKGVPCECAEAHAESHAGEHEHEGHEH